MKPRAKKTDLPSRHDVEVHISNEFSKHITDLKQRIAVSSVSACFLPLLNICTEGPGQGFNDY
jgi:hypothetical protein